ncbi:hypothetical protein [Mycoplasmopsis cynos]|uniref:Uncharacterized protein n=1 Tax=Mycoplasmopsis cynos TaxID=171284 RepID=A0A449AHE5_9BACT|nr:hypothetical protein [Mycoplasmopsis cynos]TQC54615.1 hypothetical protein E1I74_02375 [Mycoplasmopsis cynos]WQQ13437.1 hypothetical protein RRG58_01680 [Mycoplasmopsis cynos]WQQ13712.1 hypothetical protein RRG52_03090 [Mycoplasmopsis cynos]VEU64427.1 Uncharacterised protein [Mycoplasmopsis cynos]VEU64645.1 Uncharacterised protein [Mycoplasmopsis cynos]
MKKAKTLKDILKTKLKDDLIDTIIKLHNECKLLKKAYDIKKDKVNKYKKIFGKYDYLLHKMAKHINYDDFDKDLGTNQLWYYFVEKPKNKENE